MEEKLNGDVPQSPFSARTLASRTPASLLPQAGLASRDYHPGLLFLLIYPVIPKPDLQATHTEGLASSR